MGRKLKQMEVTGYAAQYPSLVAKYRNKRASAAMIKSSKARSNAVAAKRRPVGYTRTVTRRQVSQQGQSQEYSRFKATLGRPPAPTLKQAFKELRASQEKIVFGHRNFADFTRGAHALLHKDVLPDQRYVPLLLYDLTAINTMRNSTAGLQYLQARPFLNCVLRPADAAVTFVTLGGFTEGGISYTPDLQLLRAGQANVNDQVDLGERTLLNWFSVKLNLFGSKQKVTKWCIQLIQLKDEQLDPYDKVGTYNTALSKFNGFWQSLVKPYTMNPIADQEVRATKDLKVLKTWTFIQDATTTIENDTTPKLKEFNLFIRKNQMCKWDNYFIPSENTAQAVTVDGGFTPSANASVNNYLLPKYKTYLMIRAMNIGLSNDESQDTNPSIDWNIKSCHTKLD